jgi:hypothetical protein
VTPAPMFDLGRLLRLIPALVMRDPLFRYSAIASIVALLVLIAQFAQDMAGPPTPAGAAGADAPHPVPVPARRGEGSAAPGPVTVPTIAPGRSLDGISVEPSTGDTFGKTPRGARSP